MKASLLNHWGSDLTVVNNARVSFANESKELNNQDINLIKFLARGMATKDFNTFVADFMDDAVKAEVLGDSWDKERLIERLWEWRRTPEHWAPFANGVGAQFHIKVPIFVARQLDKHQIGFVKSENFVQSEVSRRYVDKKPEFYKPYFWRQRAKNVKQGSSYEKVVNLRLQGWFMQGPEEAYEKLLHYAEELYNDMITANVCPEQARMVLPQSMYTEYRGSGSLYGWANMYNLRTDPHTQQETRELVHQIGKQMEKLFPVSWEALTSDYSTRS